MIKKSLRLVFLLLLFNLLVVFTVMAEDEPIFTLDEIIVVATKYPEVLSETAASVEVITEEDIKNINVENVADILKSLTSIQINDNGGVAALKTIGIRGSNSKQVLVLIDGQPMNSQQDGVVDLGQLTTAQIERIEILKGPASALYGANALGGVINIITKGGSEEPITYYTLGYGSFNTKNHVFSHRGKEDKVGYNLTMTKKSSEGHRDNSGLEQINFFTKFDYQLNKYSNLLFSFRHNDSELGVPGSTSWPSPNAKQDDLDTNINIQWKQKQEKTDMNLAIYRNIHERTYESTYEKSSHDNYRTGLDFNRTNYLDSHILTYGFDVIKNKIESTDDGKHDALNQALFIQDEWRFKEPLKILFGVRYDDHEKFGSEVCPRCGAVYTLSPKINLYTSYGKAYRTPNFDDLYWPDEFGMAGNPDLKPEEAKSYELGLRFLDRDLQGELNLFNNDVEDLIIWSAGADYVWRPYNVKSAQTKGAEIIFSKDLSTNLSTDLNYTFLDSKDKDTDQQLKPNHMASLGLKYSKNNLAASLRGNVVAGREDERESYSLLNSKISKRWTIKNGLVIDLSLEINNLLDKEYEIIADYPMPGRNYVLGVSTEF